MIWPLCQRGSFLPSEIERWNHIMFIDSVAISLNALCQLLICWKIIILCSFASSTQTSFLLTCGFCSNCIVFIFPKKIRNLWASEVPSTPAPKKRCCMPTIFPPMPIRMESLPSFSFTIDHVLANAILDSLASTGGSYLEDHPRTCKQLCNHGYIVGPPK